ncbi:MAG: sugar phosphorylase [Verrucomicrobia bacterium]|nr:sugar phosphorylase [Verrucomicrobiota bacterium]
MPNVIDRNHLDQIRRRFSRLYGEEAEKCIDRLLMMVGAYGVGLNPFPVKDLWTERDVVLITYGDSVRKEDEAPLETLRDFCDRRLRGAVKVVHILPFYPWSSDDGFSVEDYREVDPVLGNWKDVETFGDDFDLMFDLVANHCSSKSGWFKEYIGGILPFNTYFKEGDPEDDLSDVVRPRTSPLLTKVETRDGPRNVWTTFSADQIDLNWENPDVFFEFLDILMFYISQGARIIRLDAIAFLWKTVGTNCLHLPETHEVVKLFRDILSMLAPHVILLTETNVPHEENVSYFGTGDEAHMVYQFSLPPLLLHGLLSQNPEYLKTWANSVGETPPDCTFFNFTASHDGIGMRPLQGLLPDEELDFLVEEVKVRKGHVSFKTNADGSQSPYELNITYFEALSEPGKPDDTIGIQRFLTSQFVAAAFKGVPAVYLHCLTATLNDHSAVKESGIARRINRHKWDVDVLEPLIDDPATVHGKVFSEYTLVLRRRADYPAFHPDASQEILEAGKGIFALKRTSVPGDQRMFCISNFTAKSKTVRKMGDLLDESSLTKVKDIISGKHKSVTKDSLRLKPFQTVWLVLT